MVRYDLFVYRPVETHGLGLDVEVGETREKKIVRTVDIGVLVVLLALLAYPFLVKSR
jgi:hypothetical protein